MPKMLMGVVPDALVDLDWESLKTIERIGQVRLLAGEVSTLSGNEKRRANAVIREALEVLSPLVDLFLLAKSRYTTKQESTSEWKAGCK